MDVFEPQAASESMDPRNGREDADLAHKNHDFLSFLSLFVSIVRDMSTELQLSGVLLDQAIGLQDPISRGKFFSITLIGQKDLSQGMRISPENLNPLPKLVALKAPLLQGDPNSPSNKRMFSSMATELQILRDNDLRGHENIVTLLGLCWQLNSEQRPVPVFVMEAAETGNLKVFLSKRTLNLKEKVGICIDIASGLEACHRKGVIHGDLKPENVLIFKRDQNSFVAKLCDFGSSLLVSTATPDSDLPGGTNIWQAPEISQVAGPDNLQLAEIYSLGLIMWYIFATDIASAVLDGDPSLLNRGKASGDLLDTALDTLACQDAEESAMEETQLQQCIISSTLAVAASERWDIDGVLACLNSLREMAKFGGESESQHQGTENHISRKIEEALYIEEAEDHNYIFDASRASATLQILPLALLDELKMQLELVANDNLEAMTRRADAAYQYAMATFSGLHICETVRSEVEKPLDMLRQASSFGNEKAQWIVNAMHEAFDDEAPFLPAVEVPWLFAGTINGSLTARQRLEALDPQEYKKAMKILRYEYAGVGIRVEVDEEGLAGMLEHNMLGIRTRYPRMLQRLACLGRLDDISRMIQTRIYDINEPDPWGETAILVASRSGHGQVANLLLDAGADPNLASKENLTPLHFLSAFEHTDIPQLGRRLFDSGAHLEARSTSGKDFNSRLDCQFGLADGTPLLWAVAARSLTAVRTLLDLGADPFDVNGGILPVAKSFFDGNTVHFSPVDFAARMHQYQFLEIMLSHYLSSRSAESCEWTLNNNFRAVAPHPKYEALTMAWAVDYRSQNLLQRLLLHGSDHETACKKTIQTLANNGSSASEVDNLGRSALEIASLNCQPFLMAYLLSQMNDISTLQAHQFLDLLHNVSMVDDYSSFTLLLNHAKGLIDLNDTDVQLFFARTAETTNNTSFIDFYLEKYDWRSLSNRNDTEVFERAILKGHFNSARRIFEQGRVDFRKRLFNDKGDYATILGRLIARAKKFKNAVDKIEFFLSLTGADDNVFFQAARIRNMELTVLQTACLYENYRPGLVASGPVMDIILSSFRGGRHLNARVSGGVFDGHTALHLAIDGGNLPAVARLLDIGVNTNLLNYQGESPLDSVKTRWRNQARFMKDVPLEERQAKKERHEHITERLTHLLVQSGATCRKYQTLIKKIDENTILLEMFKEGISEIVTMMDVEQTFYGDRSGMLKIMRELKPGHMCLLGDSSTLLNVEAEVESQKPAQAAGEQSNPVVAQWATGTSQMNPVLARSSAGVGMSAAGARAPGDNQATSSMVEVVSSPISRTRVAKTLIDHELTELCDWFREHE